MAVPRFIQWLCSRPEGSFIFITKFVEWPVVDSTPLRSSVLYTGQS